MEKYLLEEWTQTEMELMRERGLWGPLVGSELDKWMLDMTEGQSTRKTLIITCLCNGSLVIMLIISGILGKHVSKIKS